ncbi:hypothetical protein [Stenotrophomonas phage CM2]
MRTVTLNVDVFRKGAKAGEVANQIANRNGPVSKALPGLHAVFVRRWAINGNSSRISSVMLIDNFSTKSCNRACCVLRNGSQLPGAAGSPVSRCIIEVKCTLYFKRDNRPEGS